MELDADRPELEQLTPEQSEKLEVLERQRQLLRRRGDKAGVEKTLEQMKEVCENSSLVQEAIGDNFLERGQRTAARKAYDVARKLNPKNVSADRKFAETVFAMEAADIASLLDTRDAFEIATEARVEFVQSLLCPGLGQFMRGDVAMGLALFAGFVGGIILVVVAPGGLPGALHALGVSGDRGTPSSPLVFLGLLLIFGSYMGSLIDAKIKSNRTAKIRIDHPEPPVPKNFEL